MMKKYFVYMDDGQDALRCAVPAESEKKAREYVQGNGEVIAVKDVTSNWPISVDKVMQALRDAHFGQIEIDFVSRALTITGVAE